LSPYTPSSSPVNSTLLASQCRVWFPAKSVPTISASTMATVNIWSSLSKLAEKLDAPTTCKVGALETAVAASGVPGSTLLLPEKVTLRRAEGLKVGKNWGTSWASVEG
jgi:hypothetical protein